MSQGLRLRKLADKSNPPEPRLAGYDSDGNPVVVTRPEGGWPLAGVTIDSAEPPTDCVISTGLVTEGRRDGWLSTTGDRVVVRPGGPHDDKDRAENQHLFVHLDTVVFHDANRGDVTYRVVHQPDKYVDSDDPTDKVTDAKYKAGATRVDYFYKLRLEA